MKQPNVSSMLELSTAHLRPDTRRMLTELGNGAYGALDPVAIYAKFAGDDEHIVGWLIYPTTDPQTGDFGEYDDIRDAMLLMLKYKCDAVCFDVDEDATDELPRYEYE